MTVGSAGYMAPEQIMGRAGTAADIFSWAVTIAYAASGQAPFGTGTSEVILYRILHETPDIAAVPAALHGQVAAAIDKDPNGRPTAPELLTQLTRTAALPSAGSDNPTQTVLAQTWHPSGSLLATPPPARPEPPPRQATPSWGAPPPDRRSPDTPRRAGMRRPVLLTLVLAVAILLGVGGAALAFALSGNPSNSGNTPSGGASQSPTAPATSAVTNSSAGASSPSSSSSAPSSSSTSTSSSTPSASSTPSSSSSSSSPSATTGTTSPNGPAVSTSAPG
jgi:serine/threonine protein kinase